MFSFLGYDVNEVVKFSSKKSTNSAKSRTTRTSTTASSLKKKRQDIKISELRAQYAQQYKKEQETTEAAPAQQDEQEGVGIGNLYSFYNVHDVLVCVLCIPLLKELYTYI